MSEPTQPDAQSRTQPDAPSTEQLAATTARSSRRPSVWEVYWPPKEMGDRTAIPVASFPPIVYFWPTMIVLLAGALLQSLGWYGEVAVGWITTIALALNLMVIVIDLDQKKFLITGLLILLAGLLAWLAHDKEVALVGTLTAWIASFEPTYSTDALLLLFFSLAALFVLGMMRPRLDYWRFESNEFTHYIQPFGRDQSIPRQGSTVTREVPDLLEFFLLFGGGSLVVKREGQVVARIDHVPFLGRRMIALEQLLGVTRVRATD